MLIYILHLMKGFILPEQIHDYEKRSRFEEKKQPCDKIKAILFLEGLLSQTEAAKIFLIK
jgi:hypothetical protein